MTRVLTFLSEWREVISWVVVILWGLWISSMTLLNTARVTQSRIDFIMLEQELERHHEALTVLTEIVTIDSLGTQ